MVATTELPGLRRAWPDRLFVTRATEGMDEVARAADPDGGKTFSVDSTTRGLPQPRGHLDRA